MKISEIINSSEEVIKSKIGSGPYLYYFGDEIIIDCSLERIVSYFSQGGQLLKDIEIFAYGFKKDQNDEHQYINEDDLKRRFDKMQQEDVYEIIIPEENNGITYQVPSYCGFDELLYYAENKEDVVVNCRPLNEVIQEELSKRKEKSDEIRI